MDIRGPTWELGVRYTVGNIEVGGGLVICGGGFAKRGVRTNPRTPPGYGPGHVSSDDGCSLSSVATPFELKAMVTWLKRGSLITFLSC